MILLHVCCAPDEVIALEHFSEREKEEVTAFFFNPNIFPYLEYVKRLNAFYKVSRSYSVSFVEGIYESSFGARVLSRFAAEPEGGRRCYYCIKYRLAVTAKYAKNSGYEAFSTTLLSSPKKNPELIHRAGYEVERASGIKYIPFDFRNGIDHKKIREVLKDVYKQDYCGCVFGLREQVIKKLERDKKDQMQLKECFPQYEHLWRFRGRKLDLTMLKIDGREELKRFLEILKPSSLVVGTELMKDFGLTGKWLKCGKYNCKIERR
ncbi:hypothetical protein AT15_03620 [Kosmotoga arenicorallina S304]|uniref:Epoxyqueuosine reductase QueH n=1 Tax=Kosmotoga arenicorallina S304 TaxID=1453497 RepID=A0A182C835_9BACT|nr:epoxyqueuosine reductase QueH [Kosmotoga arenicorallina]OAA31926.1 hypothetical protein AT15_03620 [Kosmotoga arenicorallina S304]